MADNSHKRAGSHFAAPGATPTRPVRPASQQARRAAAPTSTVRGAAGMTTRGVSGRTANVLVNASPRSAAQRAQATGRGGSKLPIIIGLVVALAIIGVAIFVVPKLFAPADDGSPDIAAGQMVDVAIPEGSGGTEIAKILKDAGVISATEDFYKEVSTQNADAKLKSGTYSLMTGANMSDLVRQLVSGPNTSSARVTIAEGLTLTKTAAAVESALGIPADDFIAQAKASNYTADYPFLANVQDDSLEGYLCPKTYDFSGKEVTADAVIRAMLDQYPTEIADLDFAAGEAAISSTYGIQFNDYQIVTLASIIEKEAVTEEDRPLVASVFYNRIKANMALQSDATMGYVTGGEVTADDLKKASPYNTYLNRGLPLTPICSPSLESIKAALEPAQTDYYYFLIIENGTYSNHTFSNSYDDHLAAIEKAKQDQS